MRCKANMSQQIGILLTFMAPGWGKRDRTEAWLHTATLIFIKMCHHRWWNKKDHFSGTAFTSIIWHCSSIRRGQTAGLNCDHKNEPPSVQETTFQRIMLVGSQLAYWSNHPAIQSKKSFCKCILFPIMVWPSTCLQSNREQGLHDKAHAWSWSGVLHAAFYANLFLAL